MRFEWLPSTSEKGSIERTYGQLVSGNYFDALGLQPAAGRFLRLDEADTPGGQPVVVISYPLWQSRYRGAPDAIGRSIRVNDRELSIIGVTPRRFQGTVLGLSFDMWVPATLAPVLSEGSTELQNRSSRGYAAMGRLRDGITKAAAQAELDGVMRQLAEEFPRLESQHARRYSTFWDAPRGPQRLFAAALSRARRVRCCCSCLRCVATPPIWSSRVRARVSVKWASDWPSVHRRGELRG